MLATGKFQTRRETRCWVPKTPFAPRLNFSPEAGDAGDRKVSNTGQNALLGPENTVRTVIETFPEAGDAGDRKASNTGRNTFLGPKNIETFPRKRAMLATGKFQTRREMHFLSQKHRSPRV